MKGTTVNPEFHNKWKLPQDHEVEINTFSDEGKQREFVTNWPALRNYLRNFFRKKENNKKKKQLGTLRMKEEPQLW